MPNLNKEQIESLRTVVTNGSDAELNSLLLDLVTHCLIDVTAGISDDDMALHVQDLSNEIFAKLRTDSTEDATLQTPDFVFKKTLQMALQELMGNVSERDSSQPESAKATLRPDETQATLIPTYDDGQDLKIRASDKNWDDKGLLEFGDYVLLEEIARGGMGVVYRARQRTLNRLVAVKMILTGQFASTEDQERFYSEAEAAANLNHDNIVTIYEIGEVDGQHYFSMELVEGGSLSDLIKEHPLKASDAAKFGVDICSAIQSAHENGVLHRDIKPSNILLDESGKPMVTDFGLAKSTQVDSSLTIDGAPLGTPSYMPPEQARGETESINVQSDVYSIGATIYELLTGSPPFQAATVYDTIHHVLNDPVTAPELLNSSVPRDLSTICMKCLQKNPQRRYGSALELREELQRFVDGRPILARPISNTQRLYMWCKRNPVIATTGSLAIIGVLVMVVTMTVAYFITSSALADSQKSFQRSKQTVDDFFVVVTENELLQTPNTESVRSLMLDKALNYYQDLRIQREGNDSTERGFQIQSAELEFKIGKIAAARNQSDLDIETAVDYLDSARLRLRSLIGDDYQSNPELLIELSLYETVLAEIYSSHAEVMDVDKSLNLAQSVQQLRKTVFNTDASNIEYGRLYANACMNLGNIIKERGELDSASGWYEIGRKIRNQLLKSVDGDVTLQLDLQRDLSKGAYQQVLLDLERFPKSPEDGLSDELLRKVESGFELARDSLNATKKLAGGIDSLKIDDHLQFLKLLQARLTLVLDVVFIYEKESHLDPVTDIKEGLSHIEQLDGISDRANVISTQIDFHRLRMIHEDIHGNQDAANEALTEITSLLEAGSFQHLQTSKSQELLARSHVDQLIFLSGEQSGSYFSYVVTLRAAIQEVSWQLDHNHAMSDEAERAWIDCVKLIMFSANEMGTRMLMEFKSAELDRSRIIEIIQSLALLDSMHTKWSEIYDQFHRATTLELAQSLLDDELAISIKQALRETSQLISQKRMMTAAK